MKVEWKSIREIGLPPIGIPLIVTIRDTFKGVNALRYPVWYEHDEYTGMYHWRWMSIEGVCHLSADYSEILAWDFIPEPWKEGQE